MLANRLATASFKLSTGTILIVGLYLSVFSGHKAPAQDKNPAVPGERGKERRFDSTQSFLVFQIVDDRTQPKFLGVTPTPNKKGIVVPDDDEKWFVVPANEALGAGIGGGAPAPQAGGQPGEQANNPNIPNIPGLGNPRLRPGKLPKGLSIIGGLGLVGGGLGIGGGLGLAGGMILPGMNQLGGRGQLGGLGQLGQLPNIPGLDPSKLPAGFVGLPAGFGGNLPAGFGGRGNIPAGFRGEPANFAGNPGGDGGFAGGNIIPPKGDPNNPAPPKPPEKKKAPDIISAPASTVSTDDDAPVQVAQVVVPRLPTLPRPNVNIKPVNPGVRPGTKSPGGKRHPVSEANIQELVDELKKNNIPGVSLENINLKDSDLAILTGWPGLKTLVLRNTSVTDEGLRQLSKFPALRNLVLDGDFTARGLAHLKDRSLNILELSGKHFGNDGIAALEDLKELKVLRLRWTRITDAGLKTLVGLKNLNDPRGLETIELLGQDFTDTGIGQLAALQGLRKVRLYLTKCSDAGLESLSKIADLQALTVDSCSDGLIIPFATVDNGNVVVRGVPTNAFGVFQRVSSYSGSGNRIMLLATEGSIIVPTGKVTNGGLQAVKAMKALKELEVTNWNISDAGLEPLQNAFSLTSLKIDSPGITNKGLAHLKDLGRLETLDLRCTQINGNGAQHLQNLAALKTVYVALSCTDDDLASYRKTLPAAAAISRGNPYDELNQILGKLAPSK